MIYEGTAVSEGAAIGSVFQYKPGGLKVEETFINKEKIEENICAYQDVLKKAEEELQALTQDMDLDEEQKKIFQAHIDICLLYTSDAADE